MTPETDPEALAAIAARAYRHMTAWSAGQIADTLAQPSALLTASGTAFVLGQVVADEAEILALATDPRAQRQGAASAVLTRFLAAAGGRGAIRVFLEVAEDNAPAIAFYTRHGFAVDGRRKGYYRRPGSRSADALIMSRALP